MANIKVRDLTDTTTISTDNSVMVLTNNAENQVQNITIENLLTNIISSDADNVLEQGIDNKLYVQNPEVITGDLEDLTTVDKYTLVGAINELDSDIITEGTTRLNADNNLQSQIDAITAASDVTDIVGTYAELQAYDTTNLPDNSIIKVLQDESQQDKTTYYRWVITGGVGAWVLIGEEGPYYTKSQADTKFALQTTVGSLANLDTSDKTSIVNAINELSNVLDPTQTPDYINNSKGLLSGEVSTNSIILQDVTKYAHSTFDSTKFTKVGSSVITDDGIASGFSTANYLTKTLNINNCTNLKVECVVTVGAKSQNYIFDCLPQVNNLSPLGLRVFNNMYFNFLDTNNAQQTIGNTVANIGDTYFASFELQGTNIIAIFKNLSTGVEEIKTAVNVSPITINEIKLGIARSIAAPWQGSIDLKQFSITVDGIPVFSGNKTGIDTIKPDDYTVVGTPTISADGLQIINTGNPYNNYVKSPSITFGSTFEINVAYTIISGSGFRLLGDSDSMLRIWMASSNMDVRFVASDDSVIVLTGTNSITPIGTFIVNVVFNGSQYVLKIYKNGSLVHTNTVSSTLLPKYTILNTQGSNANTTANYNIDLNSIKIYSNGNLVCQPCLKIPYTQSKTGSKIVNSVYRDRVADMYTQFGSAPYYTLSDTDFTLPQGEVYGMKVDKINLSPCHVVTETYVNGASWYRVYDDGWCEQGGLYAVSSSSPHTITLLKEMHDTSYDISATAGTSGTADGTVNIHIRTDLITTTSFGIQKHWTSNSGCYYWTVCGYIS